MNHENNGENIVDNIRSSLNQQLTELNERARAYTTKLWQIPFTFFALTGVVLGSFFDKDLMIFQYLIIFFIILGLLVLRTMYGMLEGVNRAVKHINEVENKLGLASTAMDKSKNNIKPLIWAVILSIIALIVLFIKSCQSIPSITKIYFL